MSTQFEKRKKKNSEEKVVYTHTTAVLVKHGLHNFSIFKVDTNPETGHAKVDLSSEKKIDGDKDRASYEMKMFLLDLKQI